MTGVFSRVTRGGGVDLQDGVSAEKLKSFDRLTGGRSYLT